VSSQRKASRSTPDILADPSGTHGKRVLDSR
jgi:hypothetical protein